MKEGVVMKVLLALLILFVCCGCQHEVSHEIAAQTTLPMSLVDLTTIDIPTLILRHDSSQDMQLWDSFIASTNKKQNAKIKLIQYTIAGDPITYILSYHGIYTIEVDASLDRFTKNPSIYQLQFTTLTNIDEQGNPTWILQHCITDHQHILQGSEQFTLFTLHYAIQCY